MLELVTTEMLIQIALSAGLFLALWGALSRGVFRHFIAVIEEREARTVGDETQAKEFERQTLQLDKQLDDALLQVKIEALRARDLIVDQAETVARTIIDQAKEEAEQQLLISRAELAQKRQAIESELATQSEALAGQLVKKVIEHQQITVH